MSLSIENARILRPNGAIERGYLAIEDGAIAGVGPTRRAARRIDGSGLLLLPGIVDLHGDAFERQIMPRPGVRVPLEIALADTDRQMIANGITTAYHGVTCSWEPGLRGLQACRDFLAALAQIGPQLACDTRMHLRFETYNLDAAEEARGWISAGQIGILAFNDHAPGIHAGRGDMAKASKILERTGLSHEKFIDLVERVLDQRDQVDGAMKSLAAAARARNVPLMSHDDEDGDGRRYYAGLGCEIAEFPKSIEAAATARDMGHAIIMGAPNVMRGGSHNGAICATTMVRAGLCRVLASDYYYPSQLVAAFRLADKGVSDFADCWRLVSANPARAVGFGDRGEIALGQRADLVLVDDRDSNDPRVIVTIADGVIRYMADCTLLRAA